MDTPLPPCLLESWGYGEKTDPVFDSKGLTSKVFENKRLKLSKSAENSFGAASRAVLGDGRTPNCPNLETLSHRCGMEVYDGGHGPFVMKNLVPSTQ